MKRMCAVLPSLLLCAHLHAATPGPYDGKVNGAISGILYNKLSAMGFGGQANLYDATAMAVIGTFGAALLQSYGSAAVASGSVLAGAPVLWLPALGGLAVGASAGVGLYLAANGLTNWLFKPDGTVSTSVSSGALVGGMSARFSNCGIGASIWGGSVTAIGGACFPLIQAAMASAKSFACNDSNGWCSVYDSGGSYIVVQFQAVSGTVPAGVNCGSGIYNASNGSCSALPLSAPTSIASAIASIPQSDTGKPLNPQILAGAVNQAWQNAAAKPGYQGIPYDPTVPVTVSDVAAWQAAHATDYPTVQSAIAPIAPGAVAPFAGTVSVPSSAATSGTGTETVTGTGVGVQPVDVVNKVSVDLGADPGITFPGLEAIPTTPQILDPLFSLLPSLRTYSVPDHTATCPTATLNLFNGTQSFDAHCNLLEQVHGIVAACMLAVWALVSLRVTLSA
ncbi:hypothetical protein EGT07_08130 [Herbaspirillum sp. HC18]|nr:hypothetical protein EGT07_08130 [Herbaspirillum sp. HC18]